MIYETEDNASQQYGGSMRKKKLNFKHGHASELDQKRSTEFASSGDRPMFNSVITTSTIEVKIDKFALDKRNMGNEDTIKKFV